MDVNVWLFSIHVCSDLKQVLSNREPGLEQSQPTGQQGFRRHPLFFESNCASQADSQKYRAGGKERKIFPYVSLGLAVHDYLKTLRASDMQTSVYLHSPGKIQVTLPGCEYPRSEQIPSAKPGSTRSPYPQNSLFLQIVVGHLLCAQP